MTLRVRPLAEHFGAEIIGFDVEAPFSPTAGEELLGLFYRYQVIAIRRQSLAPERLVAFARLLGELEPFFIGDYNHADQPEIYVLSNVREHGRPIGRDGAGTHWHSDSTFTDRPSAITVLQAIEVPARGGDTLFCDMYGAYARLDAETKARIDGRRAIHRYQKKEHIYNADPTVEAEEQNQIDRLQHLRAEEARLAQPSPTANKANTVPDKHHPVVRTHPVTGRKALYLNDEMTTGIDGMEAGQGAAMLRRLCLDATRAEGLLRYHWNVGDIVAWDNASVLHSATFTPPEERRIMHRLTVQGTVPF